MSGKSKERPRRSFAEPEDDEATGLQRKRRNSFSKLQDKLGEESEDAAEVVVAQASGSVQIESRMDDCPSTYSRITPMRRLTTIVSPGYRRCTRKMLTAHLRTTTA